jgi:VWA domain-containing protein
MNRPAIERELFLPLDTAWWDGGRFTLGRQSGSGRPAQRGVRLQEPRPGASGPLPERDTQSDLCALFSSVAELRRVPELLGLVLSEETLIGEQTGAVPGKRVVFGLHCDPGGRYQAETPAAGECYRVVRRTVERAGYRVEHPREPYNPATGFAGLRNWAAEVRLRRKPDWRPWLLLLLLIPLFFLLRSCRWESKPPAALTPPAATPPDTLFRVPVESDSFIILLDKSGSMGPYFAQVRDEARKLLHERSRDPAKLYNADLIVYDAETESVLGDLQQVTPERIAKITTYLNDMTAGGRTNLAVAVDLASKEVVRHKKKTTLIVITDGEDKTIPIMIRDKKAVLDKFGGVPVTINAITPRLFGPGADPRPATFEEEDLATFCKCFNGRFGPVGAVP